jgi:hypothetical protein
MAQMQNRLLDAAEIRPGRQRARRQEQPARQEA